VRTREYSTSAPPTWGSVPRSTRDPLLERLLYLATAGHGERVREWPATDERVQLVTTAVRTPEHVALVTRLSPDPDAWENDRPPHPTHAVALVVLRGRGRTTPHDVIFLPFTGAAWNSRARYDRWSADLEALYLAQRLRVPPKTDHDRATRLRRLLAVHTVRRSNALPPARVID
jgi:hypothetical protein